MTLPRSVADVVSRHVLFEIESIDRMYCNLYVPQLQRVEGLLLRHEALLLPDGGERPSISPAVVAAG
jgi:hypothetical protein